MKVINKPFNIPKNDIDLGYLAGILDGEGHIQIRSDRVAVYISTISTELVDFLRDILDNINVQENGRYNPLYRWYISRATDVYVLLRELLPHIRIKQKQVEKAFVACEERLLRAHGHLKWR